MVVRAFITRLSATAHFELFMRINDVVKGDTGKSIQFHFIGAVGIETIVADAHKGQALGRLCSLQLFLLAAAQD